MMGGWIVMAGLALACGVALIFFAKDRRTSWSAVVATLVLAMAGYAMQGQPSMASAAAKPQEQNDRAIEALIAMRADMDYQFTGSKQWLLLSDSFARQGKYGMAAAFLQSALRKSPRNADLWAGLGLVLMLAGEGELSPPARLAFANTRKLAPNHPAPDYFEGLNQLLVGDPKKTLALWKTLAERAPKSAKWKPKLESQVNGLATMIEQSARAFEDSEQNNENK
jgi:cytochrome c-type biogenesis protein CcmH